MTRTIGSLAVLAALGSAPLSQAGFYEDLFRGLDLLATPSGSPLTQGPDGTRVNGARFGRLRIVRDRIGRGYRLEFDRGFGQDSRGRPETLDLGPLELQLAGTLTATLGYTSRGWLVGNATVTANNLNYAWRAKSGPQDIQLFGTLTAQQNIEFDQFGFYSAFVSVNNANSQLAADGVILDEDFDTNFDIGPIAVRGNIFFDGLVALLASYGVDTTALEGLFPQSPVNRIVDAIQERLGREAQEAVAGLSMTAGGLAGPPGPPGAGRSLLEAGPVEPSGATSAAGSPLSLPEPGTLLLLGLGSGLALACRGR